MGGCLGAGLGALLGCRCDGGGIACNVISLCIDVELTNSSGLSRGIAHNTDQRAQCLPAGCGKQSWGAWGLLWQHVGCYAIGDGVACNAKALNNY